ncbi:N-ATPase, AtpR subunit [Rhodovulum sp. ES.010]|uniref:N-ATPase subunit AtpR n=1 Tax=Rhodovulum sp. ES.010 TaxID=1882821 RepID=UPI00092BCD45|nr:ATP synthase subunit I [Rhodovulum sp. ES.010]SIO28440.1 N-ATPase, AtpR subunit [Rhodovulum sp. ES.010]
MIELAAAAVAGAAVAAIHLGLLWLSVRALSEGGALPVFVALGGLRAAVIAGALALALVLGAGAGALVAGLLGFVVVRIAVTRRASAGRDAPWR